MKRKKTFLQFKKITAQVYCIQEAHITEKNKKLLEDNRLGDCFTSLDSKDKKRGVVTYFKKLKP